MAANVPKRANLSPVKSPSERGVIGAWAYQARTEADLSVEQVAERIGARGQAVSAATIRGIESGAKKPGARLLRLMGQVLESTPPGSVAPVMDGDPVAAAIDRQTEAIKVQTAAIQAQTNALLALLSVQVPAEGLARALENASAFASQAWAQSETPHPVTRPAPAKARPTGSR